MLYRLKFLLAASHKSFMQRQDTPFWSKKTFFLNHRAVTHANRTFLFAKSSSKCSALIHFQFYTSYLLFMACINHK